MFLPRANLVAFCHAEYEGIALDKTKRDEECEYARQEVTIRTVRPSRNMLSPCTWRNALRLEHMLTLASLAACASPVMCTRTCEQLNAMASSSMQWPSMLPVPCHAG